MVSARGEASSRGGVKSGKWKLGIDKSFMERRFIRPKNNPASTATLQICAGETAEIAEWFRVDIDNLLFTRERDFLVKNNNEKVMVGDLRGKAIVLYMAPLYKDSVSPRENLDMIQSYNELLPFGDVEFVLVPIYVTKLKYGGRNIKVEVEGESQDVFNHLFSTLPFPAVPFSEAQSCGGRLVETFSVEDRQPNWVIIDRTGAVVHKRGVWPRPSIFRLYGGAELHPLSAERMQALEDEFDFGGARDYRLDSTERLINKWDQLLARDFLLSSDGGRVPISTLKDKVIGLYFCDNVPRPPRMGDVKKVYEEAKLRGYGFQIVQINFHYHFIKSSVSAAQDMSVQQFREDVSWLTLPFKDPSCKKLQRIFPCLSDYEDVWRGDCLVIIDPRRAGDVLYEFSGAEIIDVYGIEGYAFTRQHLFELEIGRQKELGKLPSLFPLGERHFTRPAGKGPTGYSQLLRKRVLVLVGKECESCAFVSMLKYKYCHQLRNSDKFEVVFVSIEGDESRFKECIKGMPWLVHPFSNAFGQQCLRKIRINSGELTAAVFDVGGELVAKCSLLVSGWSKVEAFPFFRGPDLEAWIRSDVESFCKLDKYGLTDY